MKDIKNGKHKILRKWQAYIGILLRKFSRRFKMEGINLGYLMIQEKQLIDVDAMRF